MEIKIGVKLYSGERKYAIVRRVDTDDDHKVIAKFGLTNKGEWEPIPEGAIHPEHCRLKVFEMRAAEIELPQDGIICDACEKPAVSYCRDLTKFPNDELNILEYRPVGKPRYGCEDHPPEPSKIFSFGRQV